jgi:tRNA threonylcarbamoyladenosine biosynthesis protein TsaB
MLILAADTSTPYLSVALCDDDRVCGEMTLHANRQHAEKILIFVDTLLKQTNKTLADIDLFAVTVGPGSFTGLRVGVSAWKGLASGVQTPITGISTLDALVARIPIRSGQLCPILDAKMDEVYAALYTDEAGQRTEILAPVVEAIESVLDRCTEDTLFFGDGATKYRDEIRTRFPNATILSQLYDAPTGTSVALEAWKRHAVTLPPLDNPVVPIYLRKSQAEENLKAKNAETASS